METDASSIPGWLQLRPPPPHASPRGINHEAILPQTFHVRNIHGNFPSNAPSLSAARKTISRFSPLLVFPNTPADALVPHGARMSSPAVGMKIAPRLTRRRVENPFGDSPAAKGDVFHGKITPSRLISSRKGLTSGVRGSYRHRGKPQRAGRAKTQRLMTLTRQPVVRPF